MMGYIMGTHAPFKRKFLTFRGIVRRMLLAHGEGVKVIRKYAKTPTKIGIAMAATTYIPDDETPEALEKARYYSFDHSVSSGSNSLWMDPIALGKAAGLVKNKLSKQDLEIISQPIDFVGVNVYQPSNYMIPGNKAPEDAKKTALGSLCPQSCGG